MLHVHGCLDVWEELVDHNRSLANHPNSQGWCHGLQYYWYISAMIHFLCLHHVYTYSMCNLLNKLIIIPWTNLLIRPVYLCRKCDNLKVTWPKRVVSLVWLKHFKFLTLDCVYSAYAILEKVFCFSSQWSVKLIPISLALN